MVDVFSDIAIAFVLGVLTPLAAVCVLPLYPGFLAYLSNQAFGKEEKSSLFGFGLIVTAGVIAFMGILGLLFTTVLQVSLTSVIGIVSPIAFGILALISILLIADFDLTRIFPQINAPTRKNPFASAFVFGFFFGAIVVPCNPLFISALFTRNVLIMDFAANMISFLSFGLGIAFPLLVFSAISSTRTVQVMKFLSNNKRKINLISGIAMLAISLYYLIFVFRLLG